MSSTPSYYDPPRQPTSPGPLPTKTPLSPPPTYAQPTQPPTYYHAHQGDHKAAPGPYPRPGGYPPGAYPSSHFGGSSYKRPDEVAYYETSSNTSSSGTRSGTHTGAGTEFVVTEGTGRGRRARRKGGKDVAVGFCAGCAAGCCCCAACEVM